MKKLTLVILAFAVIGVIMTFIVKGAPGMLTVEPESGQQSGNAEVINDSTASGGKALLFKSVPASPPPSSGDPQIPARPNCTKNVNTSNAQSTINSAQAGDTICLDSGTYSGICIVGKQGTANARITVMSIPGKTAKIVPGPACGPGMYWVVGIKSSDYITVRNLEITGGTGGIAVHSSVNIDLIENFVHTITQDSINVAKNRTGQSYNYDPNSRNPSHVRIMGNTIKGQVNNTYSSSPYNEGIYLGHSQATYNLSTTVRPNNILIYKNDISWVASECIDAKAFFYDLQIIDNVCHHARPESGGAFTISQVNDPNLPNFPPPNINTVIKGNKLYEIRKNPNSSVGNTSVQICDGDVVFENNAIWNADSGFASCGTPTTAFRTITMKDNTIFNAPTAASGMGWTSNPGGATTVLFVNAGGNKSNQNLTFMGAQIISSCAACTP